jgi:hypothetical protein
MQDQMPDHEGFQSTSSGGENTESEAQFGVINMVPMQNTNPIPSEEPMWCVKVFGFNGEDSWVDMGTGITCLEIIKPDTAEETKKLILTVSNKDINDPNVMIDRDANIDEEKRIKFRGGSTDADIILQVDLRKGLGFGKQNRKFLWGIFLKIC